MAMRSVVLLYCLLVALVASAERAYGDETDQFILPDREKFTDLGPYFDMLHFIVLERVVDEMNERIEQAQHISNENRRRAVIDSLLDGPGGTAYL